MEPGAEPVDRDRLEEAVAAASATDLALTVAVLTDTNDALAFADGLSAVTGGTALVFTPSEYGAASSILSQGDLDRILGEAASRLEGADVVAGVDAFVEAAEASGPNWLMMVGVALLVLVVVAVVGRRVERKASASRRQAALAKTWSEMESRADLMADAVLELSTRVELDGRREVGERYRDAASLYGHIRDALATPPHARLVDRIDSDLSELESSVASLRRSLGLSVEET